MFAASKSGSRTTAPVDPYFQDVTLLLNGDGTNGAQNNTFIASNGAAQGPYAIPDGYWSNYFDGSSYLQIAANSAFNMNTYCSFEAWVCYTSLGTSTVVCGRDNSYWIGYNFIAIGGAANKFVFTISNGSTWQAVSSTTTPTAGTWYHVVGVKDNTTLRIYINGVQENTSSFSGTAVTGSYVMGIASNQNTANMAGYISNVRLVLGASSGVLPYTSNFTPSTTPLTAISGTSLLTCRSNVVCDVSSNLFPITVNGSAAVNSKTPFTVSASYDPNSFSGYFDGNGDHLTVPNDTKLQILGDSFTLDCWIYLTAAQANMGIIGIHNNSSTGYFIRLDTTIIRFWTSAATVDRTYSFAQNTWYHIAVVSSGTTGTLYVNGVAQGATFSTNGTQDTSDQFIVGKTSVGTNYFTGYISDVRVIKGTAVYTSTFTPPTAPLTAVTNTQLLTCQSATFVDNSPNNFTITANGDAKVATASNSGIPITRSGNAIQGSFSPYGNFWSNYFGGSSYLTVNSSAYSWWNNDFTIEFWVNTKVVADSQVIMSSWADAGFANGSWGISINSAGIVGIANRQSSGTNQASFLSSGSTVVNDGLWHHIAITQVTGASKTFRLFVDGILRGVKSETNWTALAAGSVINIGTDWPPTYTRYNYGYISNIRLATQVVSGYSTSSVTLGASIFTPPTTQLTAISGTLLLTCQSNRFIDNSLNNYSITIGTGTPSVQRFSPFQPTSAYSTSVIGGSGYFDGSGDYLTAGANANLALGSGNFTVDGWYYLIAAGGGAAIYSGINTYPSSTGLILYVSNTNTITVDCNGTILTAGSSPTNQWVYFSLVRSGSTITLYINSVSAGTATLATNLTSQYAVLGVTGAGASSNPFNGYLANIRVTPGTAIVPSSNPSIPNSIVSGTQFLANMTNAGIPDAAMMNDLETVGNAQVSTSVKKYGTGSLYFDGTGDWLVTPNRTNLNVGSGDFTVEAWIYTGSTSQQCIIGANRSSDGVGSWMFNINYTGKVRFFCMYSSGTVLDYNVGTGTISDSTWHHIAVTRNGSSLRIFVDGSQVGTTNTTLGTASIDNASADYRVGSTTDSGLNFNGYIDDLRITKGYARYTANFTPPTAALPTY